MSPPLPTLCIMLKAPRPGEVKTRLGREIGFERACAAYRRLAEHQLAQIGPEWPLELHYAPAGALAEMQEWLGPSYTYVLQCEGDLGRRLQHAMLGAFARQAAGVLIIGGDCPSATTDVLAEAASQLETHDAVIGPAEDGGYYLLGMRKPQPLLFEEIDWSTERVFRQTMAWLKKLKLRCVVLPTFADVDDLACWKKAQVTLIAGHLTPR